MATIYKTKQFQDIYDGKIQDGFGLTGVNRTGINAIKVTDAMLSTANNVILTSIVLISNSLLTDIFSMNDDLDIGNTLQVSVGLWALGKFTSVVDDDDIYHDDLSEVDGNILVSTTNNLQAENDKWEIAVPNTTKSGAPHRAERLWELLGYDKDPGAAFIVGIKVLTVATDAPATGDLALRVDFVN